MAHRAIHTKTRRVFVIRRPRRSFVELYPKAGTVTNGADADGIGGNFDRPLFNPSGTPGVRAQALASSPTGYVNPDVVGSTVPIDPKTARYIGLPAFPGSANPLPTGNLGRNTLAAARHQQLQREFPKDRSCCGAVERAVPR
jgi:hypothetical protein